LISLSKFKKHTPRSGGNAGFPSARGRVLFIQAGMAKSIAGIW
jgi:hypothetical protein